MTEIDVTTAMNSDTPTLYLGFENVLHHSEAWLDTLGRVSLESGGKPFAEAHHLIDALTPYPCLRIVLTTNWAWWVGDEKVIGLLPTALSQRVTGTTREFPPRIDETENGCGDVGPVVRHATAHRLKSWLAIGGNFRCVPTHLTSRFLRLSDTGLEASSNREALRAGLQSNFKKM
ncbi:HAD domain-containing protein [Paraburkholderia bryophila]|uniref:HAD domain-containing protein n=1 Tax=Paraburkholderia bryophila TaxID=420952 RepID=UPI0011BDCACF|nr:HAD domain-containing protein [Paraburkholderia bryophila]